MAITLTHVGRTPAQQQFGLATFTERFKANEAAGVVFNDASVPHYGEAHPDYPFMFVTDRYVTETGEQSSAIDLVYMGCMQDSGGSPILPPQQNQSDTQIQSATSSRASTGVTLTSPATLQFYAPSNVLTYMSYLAPGTDQPDNPTGSPSVITWTVGDTSYSIGNLVTDLINIFFTLQTVVVSSSVEIVATKYWQNTCRKTMIYVPFIFDVPSGGFITLGSPGNGYTVGDTISISAGGEGATMVVDSVGGVFGGSGILAFHVTADTFTSDHNLLAGSGGTGSGSLWNVLIIP